MRGQLTARALALIRSAAPANFGMVMATGIVSIALHLLGMEAGALALFYVNIGMFCCLWAVYILRLGLYPRDFFGDMADHARGRGYLTMVAGTGLLANQCALLLGRYVLAWGFAAWWVVMLFILGFWRHAARRFPFVYTPGYWSMVFPMGMFTACTIMCSKALGVASLMAVPRVFIYVSVLSWLCTFWGLGRFLWRSLR